MIIAAQKFSDGQPSTPDDIEKAIQVFAFKFDYDLHEQVHAKVVQILDPIKHLHDIDKTHFHALTQLLCHYQQVYACNMMTKYCSSTFSQEAVI